MPSKSVQTPVFVAKTPAVMTPQQAAIAALAEEIAFNQANGIDFGITMVPGGRFVHEDGVTFHDAHGNILNDDADAERAAQQSAAEAEANKRAIAAALAREAKSAAAPPKPTDA